MAMPFGQEMTPSAPQLNTGARFTQEMRDSLSEHIEGYADHFFLGGHDVTLRPNFAPPCLSDFADTKRPTRAVEPN